MWLSIFLPYLKESNITLGYTCIFTKHSFDSFLNVLIDLKLSDTNDNLIVIMFMLSKVTWGHKAATDRAIRLVAAHQIYQGII